MHFQHIKNFFFFLLNIMKATKMKITFFFISNKNHSSLHKKKEYQFNAHTMNTIYQHQHPHIGKFLKQVINPLQHTISKKEKQNQIHYQLNKRIKLTDPPSSIRDHSSRPINPSVKNKTVI